MKYEFSNSDSDESYDLKIYDYIGTYDFGTKELEESLNKAKGKPLNVYINSYGGEVFEGFAIYNILKRYEGYKTITVDGIAASIASVIALSGDKLRMNKASMFMIHNASSWAYGTADEMDKVVQSLRQINSVIREIYLEKVNVTEAQLAEMMNAEKYLTAQECFDYGFADEIIDETPDEEKMDTAMQLFNNSLDKRIKQLNDLKKIEIPKKEENKRNQAIMNWLKGDIR